jgi:hypothetical protein
MYQKFNNLIYDHFFKREVAGSTITLSIYEEMMTDIASQMKTSKDALLNSITDYLKDDWEKIISSDIDGVPQYLGLIAVQVYAAHLMQKKDGEYTEKAYLTHLNQLFGYEGNYKIESLFKNYQDKIWNSLKKWALNRDFDIQLPSHKTGRYRYVQYPLSQALLNKEDLTWVPILFQDAGIRLAEDFSIEDFTALVFPAACGKITRHFDRVYTKYPEGVQRQIFKHYQQWDGTIPETFAKEKKIRAQHCEENTDELVLERRQGNNNEFFFDLYIVDGYSNRKAEFSMKDPNLFFEIRKFYRLPHNDIITFTQDVDYGDWIATRFLQFRISCIVLCRKDHPESFRIMEQFREIAKNDYSSGLYHLLEILINDPADVAEPIKKYFNKSKIRVTLQNGLKLGRKIWMEGAGPDILIEGEDTRWWLDGEKKENNKCSCRNLTVGGHTIKIPDNTPVKFSVETPNEKIPNWEAGWKVSTNPPLWCSASEAPVIKGLILAEADEKEDVPIIRLWSEAVMKKGDKGQSPSSPVVVNAIRRKYHGIR